jgi:2-polyprenyl-3-methyl-5-hydroxy-6-metoxy-1,4-benzoquinol methylase
MQYFESQVFGEWCRCVYGADMKQLGMVTKSELELFFREVTLPSHSQILDIGCGPGYITAAVAKHYKSHVTGIDIDNDVIDHANRIFSDDTALDFYVQNGNEVSYNAESFDLIYFFDTLYFTQSAEKLRSLLDKCFRMVKPAGKLAVFWRNQPNKYFNIFDMEPTARHTQAALWGLDNQLPFKAFDLTESHRLFWYKAAAELKAMERELRAELPEHFKKLSDECAHFTALCDKGDAGGLFRWLYVFDKN